MKLFKEFCKNTIFTYEWSEFGEAMYIVECKPDNNMILRKKLKMKPLKEVK
jgi:hypothetical protein